MGPLTTTVHKFELNKQERDFYKCIYKQSRSKFDTYVDKGTLLHNYAHIFDLLSRLRQAADHPYLVVHANRENKAGGEKATIPSKSQGGMTVCGICQDQVSVQEMVLIGCKHTFH